MTSQPKPTYLTPEEYLAFERNAEYKNEYIDGEVFAMTGASRRHNIIAVNLTAALHPQLRGRPCEAYVSEMRVRVPKRGYLYPDLVVVCAEDVVEPASVQCALALREVYEKVTLPPGDLQEGELL